MKLVNYIIAFLLVCLAGTSCASSKIYQTAQTGHLSELVTSDTAFHQPIQSDNKISLSVWDNDNLSFGSVFNIYNANESFGKWMLVDAYGYVSLPKIGKVQLKGLTCPEAAEILTKKYAEFLVNPIVVIKVLNKEVSILGEVVSPGNYTMDKEVVTISEALAKAKGLDQFANPVKIQLIRNDTSYRINLSKLSTENLHSVVLRPDDIIYVPAKKIKTVAQNAPVLIPFASVLTSVAVFVSLLK
ncbi:MAG: polysaccharide biosynthesis/export family protein [Crocinitomicaceae bacterium]